MFKAKPMASHFIDMRTYLSFFFVCICLSSSAQVDDFRKAYDEFRNQAQQEYEDFRKKANEEYAEFMRKTWENHKTLPAKPKPIEKDVPPVVIKDEEKKRPIEDTPVIIEEEIDIPAPTPQPKPISPIKEKEGESDRLAFALYGTKMSVRLVPSQKIKLAKLDINEIAKTWDVLSSDDYNNVIRDCLELRIKHQLCDWAYLRMIDKLSSSFLGEGTNEAELFKAFLYCQSGYQMRLAMANNRLYMLYASQHSIFEKPCWKIDDIFYYADNCDAEQLQICEASFPHEQAMSLYVPNEQNLAPIKSANRTLQSEDVDWLRVDVSENENTIKFCDEYPTSCIGDNFMTRWAMYANMPLSNCTKEQLYPQFTAFFDAVKRSFEEDGTDMRNYAPACVDLICHWIQTAFVYEYDDKVWGGDRAFFADETLYYPYCDCEDRSILLTRMVRDLLGLKCALVYYPGHLATAIAVGEDVKGDFIRINGTKFLVCDPTYIGAPIGMTMPGMDNQSAKVIVLN